MTENSSITTRIPEARVAPSTEDRRPGTSKLVAEGGQIRMQSTVQVGDIVLVLIDAGERRPMLVTAASTVVVRPAHGTTPEQSEFRLNGTIFCEPDDHSAHAFRGGIDKQGDPARLHGRPDRVHPLAYGECLAQGSKLGQWIRRGGERS